MKIFKDRCKAHGARYQLVLIDTLTLVTIMWELHDAQ